MKVIKAAKAFITSTAITDNYFNLFFIMLKKLITRFSSTDLPKCALSVDDEKSNKISELKDNSSCLMISTDSLQNEFQSFIISSSKLNNTIILDSLFPTPDFKIPNNTLFYCQFENNGESISFTTKFIKMTELNNLPALLVQYPTEIKVDQRRKNFRLNLKPGQISTAKINPKYQQPLSGVVKDISNHGLRINIHVNENIILKQGDILPSCRITLDDKNAIECQLTIRNRKQYNRPYRHTQIGTEITDIQLSDRKLLSKYVNKQQREQCRLRATDRL